MGAPAAVEVVKSRGRAMSLLACLHHTFLPAVNIVTRMIICVECHVVVTMETIANVLMNITLIGDSKRTEGAISRQLQVT